MKTLKASAVIALFCALATSSSFATESEKVLVNRLLKSPTRPTIQDVHEVLAQLDFPTTNPFDNRKTRAERTRNLETAMQGVAELIAGFEAYYPGGTWAPLGRDVVELGDAIDAFYFSIGQPGRVSRLNGSGASIRSENAANLFRFAESAGVDLELLAKGRMRPFVLFDATGFNSSSQSYLIINAIWKAAQERGISPKEIVRSIGIFNFSGRPEDLKHNNLEFDRPDPEALFERQAGNGRTSPQPGQVMSAALDRSQLTYGITSEWHSTFGQLLVQPNGKYEGTPPAVSYQSYKENRRTILADFYDFLRIASSEEFVQRVQKAAERKGYEFPLRQSSRPIRFKLPPKKGPRALSQELNELVAALPQDENVKVGQSTGYQKLTAWLSESSYRAKDPVAAAGLYLRATAEAYDQGKIGSRDFRRLVAVAIEALDVRDETAQRILAQLLRNQPSLLMILSRKSEFFLEGSGDYGASVAEKYQALLDLGLVAVDCAEALDPASAA